MSACRLVPSSTRARRRAVTIGAVLTGLASGTGAQAAPVPITGTPSPFAGCTPDHPGGQPGTLWQNSEVEPWVDVNPVDQSNLVAFWQQDRWSNGGARGLVAGVSHDGGGTWAQVPMPGITKCSGGPWDRASDPWLSFGPDGTLYAVSLTFNAFDFDEAVVANVSHDGGDTWSAPQALVHDLRSNVGDDKQSVTADPTRPGYAYAVWDRLVTHGGGDRGEDGADVATPAVEQPVVRAQDPEERLHHGPTWLARTTDGGATWEPARKIFN